MADDEHEDHWQPGQPWKPRRRGDEAASQSGIPRPVEVIPAAEVDAPAPPWARPPEDVAATTPTVVPGGATSPSSMAVPPRIAASPNERPDATVRMPIIPPPASPPPRIPSGPPPVAPSGRPAAAAPSPTPPSRTVEEPPARRPRRRFLRRLLLLITVVGLIAALGLLWVEGQLQRVETPSLAGGSGTYLIVGSDSRENLPDDLDGNFGDFGGQRADVIILANVRGGTVQMLSLPRDLKVDIPGRGADKINAAYAFGGGDLVARTIQEDLGIPVSRYLEVEFGGFAEIVDSVGGVELTFEYPTRDRKSGLEVEAGTQLVDGATALAYVRSRSTEELRDGEWSDAEGGDIARTGRQREVLEGVIGRAFTPTGVFRLPALVPAVTSSIRVGDSTHSWNLGLFGFRFATAPANESMSLPVTGSSEGGVSYVVRTDEAGPAIRAFVAGDPLPLPEEG